MNCIANDRTACARRRCNEDRERKALYTRQEEAYTNEEGKDMQTQGYAGLHLLVKQTYKSI